MSQLVKNVTTNRTGLGARRSKATVFALASLYSSRVHSGEDVASFVDQAIKAIDSELARSEPPIDTDRFAQDLREILSLDESLGITSKAMDVMTEHARTFNSSRIVIDFRPVFKPNLDDTPTAAVIVHHLKIVYRESNQLREFFVALDSADLAKFKIVLDRAFKKDATIRKMAAKFGVQCLDP